MVGVDDPHFDLGRHVRHVELASFDHETLREHVGSQFSVPFPREHPLWEVQVVTGPDPRGPGAVMTRFHHGLADGIRLVQLALSVCDRAEGATLAPWAATPTVSTTTRLPASCAWPRAACVTASTSPARSASTALHAGVSVATTNPLDLPHLGRGGRRPRPPPGAAHRRHDRPRGPRQRVEQLLARGLADAPGRRVPDRGLGRPPGVEKTVAWIDGYPLAGLRATARTLGGTLNDLLLAAVSLGLTDYLRRRGAGAPPTCPGSCRSRSSRSTPRCRRPWATTSVSSSSRCHSGSTTTAPSFVSSTSARPG